MSRIVFLMVGCSYVQPAEAIGMDDVMATPVI